MGWEDYVAFRKQQARSEERRLRGFAAQDAPALFRHLNSLAGVTQGRSAEMAHGISPLLQIRPPNWKTL
jgi:hypothetical protein